jgi:hypothetical protein
MLESETVRRMAACFAGRTCCKCGRVAVRLAHHRFYCDRHFPCPREVEEAPKVYHCQVGGFERQGGACLSEAGLPLP